MSKIRLDTDDLKHITLFESMTGAKVMDFLREGESLCYLVREGDMGLAIGRGGAKIDKVRKALNSRVLVFEYFEDPDKFVENLFTPAKVHGTNVAKTSGETVATVEVERADRGKAIGPAGAKIKAARTLAKRHHDIDDINLRIV